MSATSTKEEMLADADIPFGRGGARAGSGGQRSEDITGSAAIKRGFYTPERLLTLLETLWVVAMNKPVMQTVFDKDGTARKVRVKPYAGKEQVAALNSLTDRGFGKAVQAIDLQADVNSNGHPLIIFDFGEAGNNDDDGADQPET